jgi:hypothetical protein
MKILNQTSEESQSPKESPKRISKNRHSEYSMINNDTRLKIVFET